jgi:hypothetical protein
MIMERDFNGARNIMLRNNFWVGYVNVS